MTYQLHILFHPILADNYRCIGPHCSSSHRLHRSGKDCWYTSHLRKEIISEAVNFTNGRTQIKLINLLITFKWLSSRSWHTFKWRAISVHKMCFYIVMDPSHTKIFFFPRYNNKFCLTPNFTIKCQFQLQSIYSMIKNSSKIYIPSTVNILLKKL